MSIVGFLRSRAMRRQLDRLTADVETLQARLWALSKRVDDAERGGAAPSPARAAAAAEPRADAAAPAAPGPPPPIVPPPIPSFGREDTDELRHATPAAPVAPLAPVAPAPVAPAAPALDAPAAPVVPVALAFDWESLLGVRGAAWLGGVTLVIAALFFARWSIEQGFFSPVIRVAIMLVAGSGALLWAEVKLRDGYQTTANAMSGAGVVILYAAFFSGHVLYQLFGLGVAFTGMTVVTVVAGLIAVRFTARFTALIGLAGGLATPVLLSTGVDHPVAFFSYLTLLTAGFLYVAQRCGWSSVAAVALVGTSILQLAWLALSMDPGELFVATVAFSALGAAYLWHAVRTRSADRSTIHRLGLAGAVVPLGLAMLLAGYRGLEPQWAGVLTFVAVVDIGLVVAALAWEFQGVLVVSAVVTAIVAWQYGQAYGRLDGPPPLLPIALIALASGYALVSRVADRWAILWASGSGVPGRVSAAAILAGLLGFSWLAIDSERLPLWACIALVSAMFGLAVDRTRRHSWPGAFPIAVLLIAWVTAHWVAVASTPDTYADHLIIPHLLATAVAIVAVSRGARPGSYDRADWWQTDYAGAVATVAVTFLTALNGLDIGAGHTPLPFFILVGLEVALVLTVAVQAGWPVLVPLAAGASLVFNAAWHSGYFDVSAAPVALGAYTASYLLFLAWPFLAARWLGSRWKSHAWPWLASALVGPATFPLYHDAWRDLLGTELVGIVPVTMAATSVAALYGVSREFASSADETDSRRRLNYLALFAAIALGFVATAVPLQLERQWITIGWALEAAAVWWLFGRLPHPGLKYFGLALFLAVAARLLANPEVLRYQPRGAPILNWLLYTYGVPAICCLAGAYLIGRAERRRGADPPYDVLASDREAPGPAVAFIAVVLVFWLINVEIADYFSAGRYVELDLTRHLARDLTRSCAWGLYALLLLGVGLWRGSRGLRLVSLGFLLLTVAKVFLYDLGQLTGLYRIMSFLALGLSLIIVSLLYQRFVRHSEVPA